MTITADYAAATAALDTLSDDIADLLEQSEATLVSTYGDAQRQLLSRALSLANASRAVLKDSMHASLNAASL